MPRTDSVAVIGSRPHQSFGVSDHRIRIARTTLTTERIARMSNASIAKRCSSDSFMAICSKNGAGTGGLIHKSHSCDGRKTCRSGIHRQNSDDFSEAG